MAQAVEDCIAGFTAAQAAQKSGRLANVGDGEFTAAQAAQKTSTRPSASGQMITAAQAAQKWWCRPVGCHRPFTAAQAAQKGYRRYTSRADTSLAVQTPDRNTVKKPRT